VRGCVFCNVKLLQLAQCSLLGHLNNASRFCLVQCSHYLLISIMMHKTLVRKLSWVAQMRCEHTHLHPSWPSNIRPLCCALHYSFRVASLLAP
jgi:hypothetical protein